MAKESPVVIAGIFTTVVAISQLIFIVTSLLQYFCLLDILRGVKTLVFMKVLYYNHPRCRTDINIGQLIPEMENQAFVYTKDQPQATTRTLIVNSLYFPLILMWLLSSVMLVVSASNRVNRFGERMFWITSTTFIIFFDTIVVIMYATDIEVTKTSEALVRFAGATLSGAGNILVDTTLVPISMMIIYGRCGVFYVANLFLVCWILFDTSRTFLTSDSSVNSTGDTESYPGIISGVGAGTLIPRVNMLKRLPNWITAHLEPSPTITYEEYEEARNPRRLANIIMGERQHHFDDYFVDTSMRSPARGAHALPESFEEPTTVEIHAPPPLAFQDIAGRRCTASGLLGQLPWSYIPPSAHRMRDNLPEDEDLPPVPVPDYTLHPKYRKASVHRAGSNVSMMKNLMTTLDHTSTLMTALPRAESNASVMNNQMTTLDLSSTPMTGIASTSGVQRKRNEESDDHIVPLFNPNACASTSGVQRKRDEESDDHIVPLFNPNDCASTSGLQRKRDEESDDHIAPYYSPSECGSSRSIQKREHDEKPDDPIILPINRERPQSTPPDCPRCSVLEQYGNNILMTTFIVTDEDEENVMSTYL